jgi:hypothetical protein
MMILADVQTRVSVSATIWIGFAMMCVGMFMAILDVQVVATSLPTIQLALGIPKPRWSRLRSHSPSGSSGAVAYCKDLNIFNAHRDYGPIAGVLPFKLNFAQTDARGLFRKGPNCQSPVISRLALLAAAACSRPWWV